MELDETWGRIASVSAIFAARNFIRNCSASKSSKAALKHALSACVGLLEGIVDPLLASLSPIADWVRRTKECVELVSRDEMEDQGILDPERDASQAHHLHAAWRGFGHGLKSSVVPMNTHASASNLTEPAVGLRSPMTPLEFDEPAAAEAATRDYSTSRISTEAKRPFALVRRSMWDGPFASSSRWLHLANEGKPQHARAADRAAFPKDIAALEPKDESGSSWVSAMKDAQTDPGGVLFGSNTWVASRRNLHEDHAMLSSSVAMCCQAAAEATVCLVLSAFVKLCLESASRMPNLGAYCMPSCDAASLNVAASPSSHQSVDIQDAKQESVAVPLPGSQSVESDKLRISLMPMWEEAGNRKNAIDHLRHLFGRSAASVLSVPMIAGKPCSGPYFVVRAPPVLDQAISMAFGGKLLDASLVEKTRRELGRVSQLYSDGVASLHEHSADTKLPHRAWVAVSVRLDHALNPVNLGTSATDNGNHRDAASSVARIRKVVRLCNDLLQDHGSNLCGIVIALANSDPASITESNEKVADLSRQFGPRSKSIPERSRMLTKRKREGLEHNSAPADLVAAANSNWMSLVKSRASVPAAMEVPIVFRLLEHLVSSAFDNPTPASFQSKHMDDGEGSSSSSSGSSFEGEEGSTHAGVVVSCRPDLISRSEATSWLLHVARCVSIVKKMVKELGEKGANVCRANASKFLPAAVKAPEPDAAAG